MRVRSTAKCDELLVIGGGVDHDVDDNGTCGGEGALHRGLELFRPLDPDAHASEALRYFRKIG